MMGKFLNARTVRCPLWLYALFSGAISLNLLRFSHVSLCPSDPIPFALPHDSSPFEILQATLGSSARRLLYLVDGLGHPAHLHFLGMHGLPAA